ncbi:MAG: hypothetical protein NXI04_26465 [Planctomycetaceae bacterium]|nr:hypothetical protein [Planctomycetaceae bacterium]
MFVATLYLNQQRRFFRLGGALIGGAVGIYIPQQFRFEIGNGKGVFILHEQETTVTLATLVLGGFFVFLDFYNDRLTPQESTKPMATHATNPDRPHPFFVLLAGFWCFCRWHDRRAIYEANINSNKWNAGDLAISDVESVHGDTKRSSVERCVVVRGAAGVGKSIHATLLSREFARSHDLENTGLFLRVSCADLQSPFGSVWELACHALNNVVYQIPKLALAYAVSRRPLIIVVEDAHFLGTDAGISLRKLQEDLRATRSRMSSCLIIVTTRMDSLKQPIEHSCNCELGPLSPTESFKLLQKLIADANGRVVTKLPPASKIIILSKEGTRTPLFIGLAAYLIKQEPSRMPEIIEFQENQLISNYISKLFKLSSLKQHHEFDLILNTLRQLAVEAWPHQQISSESEVMKVSSLSLEELEQSGFLFKPSDVAKAIQFPHASIADSLAVSLMSDWGDFSKFINMPEEFLRPAMAFVDVKKESAFLALAKVAFDVSLQLLEKKDVQLTPANMSSFVDIAVQETAPTTAKLTDWDPFFRFLFHKYDNTEELLGKFCQGIGVTANGVSALCHLRTDEATAKLKEWLSEKGSAHAVRVAASQDPEVELRVWKLLDEQKKLTNIAVSIVAALASQSSNVPRLVRWFVDYGKTPRDGWKQMMRIDQRSQHVLVLAACHWKEELRRRLVQILSQIRKDARDILIPSGDYTVRVSGGEETVTITEPYALQRELSRQFSGTFQPKKMREQIPHGQTPPTRAQLLVAYELGNLASAKEYVIFDKRAYEVVDDGHSNFIGFSNDGFIDMAHPLESTVTTNVCYRTVKALQPHGDWA